MSMIFPYRIAGENQTPKPPSNRDEFVRATLEKKFGIPDPQSWIKAQAVADRPATMEWSKLWSASPIEAWEDRGVCFSFLQEYGQREDGRSLREQLRTLNLFLSVLDDKASCIFRDEYSHGYYVVISEGLELIRMEPDPRNIGGSFRGRSLGHFGQDDYFSLVRATMLRAWCDEAGVKSDKARACICAPYAKAIADAAHEAEDEFGRMTILGSRNFFNHRHLVSDESFLHEAEQVSVVVIWEKTPDGYAAWKFDPQAFNPDSFDNPRPTVLESSWVDIDERLHGLTGMWPFKRRFLAQDLRFCDVYCQVVAVKACKPSDGPPRPFEKILYIRKDRLLVPMPEGGMKIL